MILMIGCMWEGKDSPYQRAKDEKGEEAKEAEGQKE